MKAKTRVGRFVKVANRNRKHNANEYYYSSIFDCDNNYIEFKIYNDIPISNDLNIENLYYDMIIIIKDLNDRVIDDIYT